MNGGGRNGPPLVRRKQDGDDDAGLPDDVPEQLRNCEQVMIERIENEIMDSGDPVSFDDIGTILSQWGAC